jgi:small-conductance mechanosensitive channel
MFFATFLGVTVQTAASNAGIETAPFLGKIVEFFIVFFSIVVALQQMKLSIGIAAVTFNILLACLGLGLALAFGLGCKDLAGKFVAELIEKFKAKR